MDKDQFLSLRTAKDIYDIQRENSIQMPERNVVDCISYRFRYYQDFANYFPFNVMHIIQTDSYTCI